MTDDAHADTPAEALFTEAELAQLDADDEDAGRALGKMLSSFFLYTVVAMSLVAWWTYRWMNSQ